MTITPRSRSTPLALPNDSVTRPAATIAWFALQTARRRASDASAPMGRLQTPREMVVSLVPAELTLDRRQGRSLVDQHELDAEHLCEVLERFGAERFRQHRVMGAAGPEPGLDGRPVIRPRPPD